eukprot:m.44132 g.44132  ORF g.44132 m.44132 type:complete len:84 (-) comp11680_c1_seq1:143-394(-)
MSCLRRRALDPWAAAAGVTCSPTKPDPRVVGRYCCSLGPGVNTTHANHKAQTHSRDTQHTRATHAQNTPAHVHAHTHTTSVRR